MKMMKTEKVVREYLELDNTITFAGIQCMVAKGEVLKCLKARKRLLEERQLAIKTTYETLTGESIFDHESYAKISQELLPKVG